jgi:hypothetical protein
MKKRWKKVSNSIVRHIWKKNCDCETNENTKGVSIPPTFYEYNGTPICGECGQDMVYVKTEIRLPDYILKFLNKTNS